MQIIIHRVHRLKTSSLVPDYFGVEIDVRAHGNRLVLGHEPHVDGTELVDFLDIYHHGLLVVNIKEAGIENEVIEQLEGRNINQFFLLDVEFPYIYRAAREGERRIAIRYSEDESIETALKYAGKVDWVWIDTNTILPLDHGIIDKLNSFKSCIVCPERWGRPQDISVYAERLRNLKWLPDAVMTSLTHAKQWEGEFAVKGK